MSLILRVGQSGYKGVKAIAGRTVNAVRNVSKEVALRNELRQAISSASQATHPHAAKGLKKWINRLLQSKPLLRLRTSKAFQSTVNAKPIQYITDDFGNCMESIRKGLYEAGKQKGVANKSVTILKELNIKENPQYIATLAGLFSPVPLGSEIGYIFGTVVKHLIKVFK